VPNSINSPNEATSRLDIAIAQRGLARSRCAAQDLIRAGKVKINGNAATRASLHVAAGDEIALDGDICPYVSRGGVKLAAAIEHFDAAIADARCLDVGSSTGGFTDCLLQAGALSVTGVDVGHGQLDARLQADPRVDNHEGVNARTLTPEAFGIGFDVIVVDVSFISLTLILKPLAALLAPSGLLIALVKPQFEVGADNIGKNGVVKNSSDREWALHRVIDFGLAVCAFKCRGFMESPIAGGDGNVEYLVGFTAI